MLLQRSKGLYKASGFFGREEEIRSKEEEQLQSPSAVICEEGRVPPAGNTRRRLVETALMRLRF